MDLDHDGHGRDDAPVVHAREEVWKIVTQQDVQGLEDTFLVLLVEGGKRVSVSQDSCRLYPAWSENRSGSRPRPTCARVQRRSEITVGLETDETLVLAVLLAFSYRIDTNRSKAVGRFRRAETRGGGSRIVSLSFAFEVGIRFDWSGSSVEARAK